MICPEYGSGRKLGSPSGFAKPKLLLGESSSSVVSSGLPNLFPRTAGRICTIPGADTPTSFSCSADVNATSGCCESSPVGKLVRMSQRVTDI